jgi:glycosyltransferase involved in cell wall biosynthesis
LHGVYTRILDAHGFESKRATKKFLKWVDEYNPDIIWLHNIHGYYINFEMLFEYIKRNNKKVIWTMHDCWSFTGHCSHFTYAKCNKWKTGCYECCQKKQYPKSIFRDNSRNNYQRKKQAFTGVKDLMIITPSKWLADLVEESFLNEYPVKVINNEIDTNIFKPTPSDFRLRYGLENKKIFLGVASIWGERKGLNDYIRLAQMLDDNYKIVLVGLSKKQLEKLPKNILGFPRTESAKQLAEIYTAADVFVNLSYEENYPTVNLEAQACGTKVVTYDVGGTRETLSPNNQRYVVDAGNLRAIKKCLKTISL